MPTLAEIPMTPVSQTFQVTLANVPYAMAVTWRDPYGWFLDIATPAGAKLVSGIPLIAGVDLLQSYPQFEFGGEMYVITDGNPTADPTKDNLGIAAHWVFYIP